MQSPAVQSLTRPLIVILAAAAVLGGCAGGPTTRTSAKTGASNTVPADCTELNARLASSQERKSAAAAGQRDAWKVVIPFAVAARYVGASASANDADKEISQLQADRQRAGCTG